MCRLHSTETLVMSNLIIFILLFNITDYDVILFCSFRSQNETKTIQCVLIPVYGDKVVVQQEVELLREFFFLVFNI